MLRVVEQAGLHDAVDSEARLPVGKPETLKETAWVAPELKDALIELETEEPAVTEILPELDREKLKGWPSVNEALASALGVRLLLNAFALTTVLADSTKGCL